MTTAIKINANDGVQRNIMAGGETEVDFDFPIYDDTHIQIYETAVGGDPVLLVKDTDYTVPAGSIAQQAGGTVDLDGTVYPSGATAAHVFTAYQAAPESRVTDFNQAGDYFADTLNLELDLIAQQLQQIRRDLNRAPLAAVDTTLVSMTLPDPLDGFAWVWDGVAGAIRNTTASLATLEGNALIVANNIDDVNTVATDITNVNIVAGDSADIATVAGISANITIVAGDTADINTVAGISANVTTVAGDSTAINTVATNIATVIEAAEAVASALAFTFDTTTTMADPGTGDVRFNNGTLASVTALAIDAVTAQTGNPDLSDFIATWDDSTNPTSKGYIRMTKGGAPENFAIFQITAVTDNTGWLQLTVTHVDSNGSFTAADTLYLTFTRTGDQGSVSTSNNNDFTGTNTFAGKTAFKDDGELTIATGAITITGVSHTIDTQSDSSTDDLDTINGGTDGEILIIRAENTARDVVIKNGTGNILTADAADITLDTTEKIVVLQYDLALTKWVVISAPAAGSGGAWTLIGTAEASASASLTITGLDSTYDGYAIGISDFVAATTGAIPWLRFGDSGGVDSGVNDYDWHVASWNAAAETRNDPNDNQIQLGHQDGMQSGNVYSAMLFLMFPADSSSEAGVSGTGITSGGSRYTHVLSGHRQTAITLDRVQALFSSGAITSGRLTVWGISHD